MIAKAQLLERARVQSLLATTVEKDYVLGWLLYGIPQQSRLREWVFKGGKCLKKCFFETYRFSEDLDFTVPTEAHLSVESILDDLAGLGAWVEEQAGIAVAREEIKVEEYTNPRGNSSFQARLAYACRLNLSPKRLPRIKFDITQDERLADAPVERPVSHPYEDAHDPAPRVRCYSVDEILAEKTRALYERQGRARDVYDLVHLSREFRDSIDPNKASSILRDEFAFKELPSPTVERILGRVDQDTLRQNWKHQIAHQLPVLPPIESFLDDLEDAIAWWLEPVRARPQPSPVAAAPHESTIPRQVLPSLEPTGRPAGAKPTPGSEDLETLDRLRFAARNRLCAELRYKGIGRVVEPYSLRRSSTGTRLLYAFERLRDGRPSGQVKAFDVSRIETTAVTSQPFSPRYAVEL